MNDVKNPKAASKASEEEPLEISWEDVDFDGLADQRDEETERPTALPPDDYEVMAKRLMAGVMSAEEEKRALTAPGLPIVTDARPLFPTIPDANAGTYDSSDALEAAIPLLGAQDRRFEDRHEIPLEDFDFPDSKRPPLESPSQAAGLFSESQRITTKNEVDELVSFVESQPLSFQRDSLLDLPVGDEFGGALDLVTIGSTAPPPPPKVGDPLVDMRDRYAVGDFSGALAIAEAVLLDNGSNAEALRYAEGCRDILTQMYTARIGSVALIPKIVLSSERIKWLTLDHRTGFLLSCIDGRSSVEEILDVSGMPALDSLRILCELIQQQIIEMRDR